jgi:hypothetical protein
MTFFYHYTAQQQQEGGNLEVFVVSARGLATNINKEALCGSSFITHRIVNIFPYLTYKELP